MSFPRRRRTSTARQAFVFRRGQVLAGRVNQVGNGRQPEHPTATHHDTATESKTPESCVIQRISLCARGKNQESISAADTPFEPMHSARLARSSEAFSAARIGSFWTLSRGDRGRDI